MLDNSIVTQLPLWSFSPEGQKTSVKPPNLHTAWQVRDHLPACVTDSPTIMRLLELLAPLDWAHFPERNLARNWGQVAIPYATLTALELIRLEESLPSAKRVRRYLVEHPGFIWLLGFPLARTPETDLGFNTLASLPTYRHLTYLLRHMPHSAAQFLFADSVRLIRAELATRQIAFPECISLDTKHILAWVKENNPKTYVPDRFNKQRQPLGDPDCRLGCKRKHNRATPTTNPRSASRLTVGEYYWGYGSGVVVAKVPTWGEFVIAELTQPFDHGDTTYFFPLMTQVEQRLGERPRYGTFDAAFDAWYVYAYFYRENQPDFGFAAVPLVGKGKTHPPSRRFDPHGLPLCDAGLAMPLRFTFMDRTKCIIEHERGKYVCPLRGTSHPQTRCPVHPTKWKQGGCVVDMPTSIGARLRYTLDRESARYKEKYAERTATERINAQAKALGIERPHLRNGPAITNQNTLIYTLINLRFLQRLREGHRDSA